MTLDADLDLATHDGFVSCLLGTQHSGFEVHCEDEEEADLDVGLLGHMTGRDAVVTFAARGDVQNVAALLASALLVQLTAGLLVPADTGDPFDASEALAIAREAYDELAGMAAPRAAPARIRIPFAALGYPAEAPALVRFALELAGDEDVVHLLGGFVSNAGTIAHTEAGMPTSAIEGGLFDEAIFGPLARTVDGALSLPANAALHPLDAPQGRAFGRIELPAPMRSPWVERYLPAQLPFARASTTLAVLPPALRPMVFTDGVLRCSGLTTLYALLVDGCAMVRRLVELGAPPELLEESEKRFIEARLRALVLDGAACFAVEDADADPPWSFDPHDIAERCAAGEVPLLRLDSIRAVLARGAVPALGWIETQLGERHELLAIERWPLGMYFFRALLTAAGIEIVPLDANGAVDEARLRAAREVFRVERAGDDPFLALLPPELRDVLAEWKVRPGASSAHIANVEAELGVALPAELAAYYRWTNGSEGTLGETWLGIAAVEEIANLTEDHELADAAPDYLLFGTNGGAEGFAFDRRSGAIVVLPLHEPGPEDILAQGSFVSFLLRVLEGTQFDD